MTRNALTSLFSLLLVGGAVLATWIWILKPVLLVSPSSSPPALIVTSTGQSGTVPPAAQDGQALDVQARAVAFLSQWRHNNYAAMYQLLDQPARVRITQARFVSRYQAITVEATMTGISYHILRVRVTPPRATVTYRIHIATSTVGTIGQTNTMSLQRENGHWSIDWTPSLIFAQLHDPYYVHMIVANEPRGAIYDSTGHPLAGLGAKIEVDVVPAWIHDEPKLLAFLSSWLHMTPQAIKAKYSWGQPDWRMPISFVRSAPGGQALLDAQSNGLMLINTPARTYPQGGLASDVIGYIQNGQGMMGLEASQNGVLSGHNGRTLAVTTAPDDNATVIARIAQTPSSPGADIHLTLNLRLQAAAEQALGKLKGAIVAIDPTTGAVLAMVSHPGFDPNAFTFGVPQTTWDTWTSPNNRAFFNRATSGTYPLGSVFKIVSMAAALEKGGYTINSTFNSQGIWTGLGAQYAKHDWLPGGHGIIDLHEALVQSCDDCFYDVGKHLDQVDPTLLPRFGRAFGLGVPTGLAGLSEATGVMPDPAWKKSALQQVWWAGDSVNLAIGQGYLLVTPLQVASMLASVAADGVVHRPYLISAVTHADGTPITVYHPQVVGHLPVQQANLQAIKSAMLGVTTEPFGTAIQVFQYYPYSVLGKTGTAEASGGSGNPDAWFAAITPSDHPRLVLAVLVEHGGEGSLVAAPIARQIITAFYHLPSPSATSSHTVQITVP